MPTKKSLASSSIFNMRSQGGSGGGNESTASISMGMDTRRALSLVNAAQYIVDQRKQRVDQVKRGYRGNAIFDHTMEDIAKALEHKIGKRN